ncbi:hypothetical protein [Sagittula sp. S175]|uniref:hypothetical protein n=1 Tax=Sagittula sp. S175 TaxID=3415129 RepID=UPI003C7B08DC
MKKHLKNSIAAVAMLAGGATAALADQTYTLDPMAVSTQSAGGGLFATQFGAPSAIIAPKNTGFVAAQLVDPRGGIKGSDKDGDISFGYTLGNPVSGVGVMLGMDITSVKADKDFGDSGSFSLTLSRMLHAGPNSVTFGAITGSGLGGWGSQKNNERASAYVTQMRFYDMGGKTLPVMWTLGYGQDAKYVGNGTSTKEDGFFWAFGVGATDFMSVSMSGTENQANFGLGFRIPGVDGLSMSLGQYDITNNTNRTQTALSVAYSMKFGK